jgi:hypothetical protein
LANFHLQQVQKKANYSGDTGGLVKVFEKEGKLAVGNFIGLHAGEITGEALLSIKMG